MANQQHLTLLRQGVNIWNQWRKENRGIIPVLSDVNLSKENLCGADLNWANFRDANLRDANLSRANLSRANLSGANLSGANLSGANLSEAKLEYAKLRYAQISHETLIEEKWRLVWEIINHGAARKDLNNANLSEVDLSGANLSGVDLSGANLRGANLSEANLSGVDLSGAALSGANLSEANLSGANLSGVNLSGADITRADIYEANFSKANITGLIGASFNIKEFYEVSDVVNTLDAGLPVRDERKFSEILLSWGSQVSDKRLLSSKQNPLPGILLYTEQDELSDYIKNHFEYIDALTGNCFIIYLLEKPPLRWKHSNLYWKEIIEVYLYKKIPIFHWCRRIKNKPYSKSEVYDIARQWKVDINNLPCLVLFNPKNLSEKIIFDINQNLPQNKFEYYFRDLFSELDKRLIFHESQENGELRLNCTTTFKNIQIEFLSIIKFLEEKYSKKEKGVDRARQSKTNTPAKTILILAANPTTTLRLRLDEEVREIEAGLQRSKKREQFDLKQRWAVRVQDVYPVLLDFKPQFVHFSGHGSGDDGLVLEDETGNVRLVDTQALASLFKLFASDIECVVLNACYSEVQASAIALHIPYVIGMNKAIGDKAAIKFATGFYNALGAGESVEFAYKLGCNVIQLEGIPENLTPVLKKKQ